MPMKTFSLAWITSSLLLFSMSGISYAQPDNLRFENLSGQRGLPKNGVDKILQDQEGFMWFATYEGLYRFDGHTATVFQHDPNDPDAYPAIQSYKYHARGSERAPLGRHRYRPASGRQTNGKSHHASTGFCSLIGILRPFWKISKESYGWGRAQRYCPF